MVKNSNFGYREVVYSKVVDRARTLSHLISLKLLTQFDITPACSKKCQNILFLTSCITGLFHFLPTDHTARNSGDHLFGT